MPLNNRRVDKNKIIATKANGRVKTDMPFFKATIWIKTAAIVATMVIKMAISFFCKNIAQTTPIKTELKPIIPALINDFSTPINEEKIKLVIAAKAEKIPNLGLATIRETAINKPKNLFSTRKTWLKLFKKAIT